MIKQEIRKKPLKYSLEAGKVALSRFSNVEAIKHFNYVVAHNWGRP